MTPEEIKQAFYEEEKMSFFSKLKKSFTSPTELFNYVKNEQGIKSAFIFYAVVTLIGLMALFFIGILFVSLFTFIPDIGSFFTLIGILGIVTIIGIWFASSVINILTSGFTHLFVKLLGGKRDVSNTYKAACYSIAPSILLCWIPILNIFAVIYMLYVFAKGLSILQDMSFGRALAAIFLPSLIMLVVVLLILGMFFAMSALAL